jgi:hypothetical protein
MIELHPIYDGGSAGYVLVMSVVGHEQSFARLYRPTARTKLGHLRMDSKTQTYWLWQ